MEVSPWDAKESALCIAYQEHGSKSVVVEVINSQTILEQEMNEETNICTSQDLLEVFSKQATKIVQ